MRPRKRSIDDAAAGQTARDEYHDELAAMSTAELEAVLQKVTGELAKAEAQAAWMAGEAGDEAGDGARRVGSQSHRAITRDENGLIAETIVEVYDAEAHPLGLIRRKVERGDNGEIEDILEYHLPWTPREDR